MKKIIASIMIALVLCLTLVSAYTVTTDNTPADTSKYPMDNIFGRLFSGIGYSGTFTGYGVALKCTDYPTESKVFTKDSTILKVVKFVFPTGTLIGALTSSETVKITASPDEAILINWFRGVPDDGYYEDHPGDSRQYMGEIYLGYGGATSVKLTCDAGNYWNRLCYYEIYTCPKPCLDNGDCFAGQTCDKTVLSQVTDTTPEFFPADAGACIIKTPTHKTQVYSCENGVKKNLGTVSYGNLNFCDSPSETKYLVTSASGTVDQCLTYEPEACSKTTEELIEEQQSQTTIPPQVGIDKNNIASMSTSQIVSSVCSYSSTIPTANLSCETGSSCVGISSLMNDDYIAESQAQILRQSFCDAVVGNIGIFNSELRLAISSFDASYKKSCVSLTNKNSYFQQNYGLCITNYEEENKLNEYFGWAAFFDITGDKGVDGLIIILVSIIVIIILGRVATGGRR